MTAAPIKKTVSGAASVCLDRLPVLPWLLAAPVCAAAYVRLVHPFFSTDSLPGDMGDARFNLYILEHTFRYLIGLDPTYRSPEIFYPFPGTLLFSDTHLGSVPFYILFRAFGWLPDAAFTLWVFAGYLLTFLASYYALLRFKFTPVPALVAAVLFSFSLPSLAQIGHAQLIYRIGVPLAFLSLWDLVRGRLVRDAVRLLTWIGFQLLCSIYLGVFLIIALTIFGICLIASNWENIPLSKRDLDIPQIARSRNLLSDFFLIVVAIIVSAATIVLLYEYYDWSGLYGLGHSWDGVSPMVPRLLSYLHMDPLPYWSELYARSIGGNLPMAGEHNLFVGIGAFGLMIVGAVSVLSGDVAPDIRRLLSVALMTLLSLFLIFTKFGGFSLYYYISDLPGLNAIRAVARIGIVMVFPAALLAASAVQVMIAARPRLPCRTLLTFPLAVVLAEIATLKLSSFKAGDAAIRVEALVDEALAKSSGVTNPILFVHEGDEFGYNIHLDAMFAARQLGWPTINGFSGNSVPGSDFQPDCGTPARQLSAYEKWRQLHQLGPKIKAQHVSSRLVIVGWPACGDRRQDDADGLGLPPPHDLARYISLVPISLEQQQSRAIFEIAIRNGSHERLVVHSFAPVRASWRFVEMGASVDKRVGWDTRVQLGRDIGPHGSSNVRLTAELPRKSGEYRLQVSLVSERAYWFHDEGMDILQFEQPITVR